jgi:NADPH2:quinone reductase
MEGTILPHILGRDFAGVVVDGPTNLLGTEVWSTGGDAGFTRDGTHAEFIVVPVEDVTPKPPDNGPLLAGDVARQSCPDITGGLI